MVHVREKVCVCVRLGRCGVYTPVALAVVSTHPSYSRLFRLAECETQIQQLRNKKILITTRLDMRSDFVVVDDNFELVVSESNGTSCLVALTTSSKREFYVVPLTIALTICRFANCVDAIFASSKTMKMSSTRLLVTSWIRRMAGDLLVRNIHPNFCSATQGTLAVKDQSCHVSVAFHSLG